MSLTAKYEFSAVLEGQDVTTSKTVICFVWNFPEHTFQTRATSASAQMAAEALQEAAPRVGGWVQG